MIPALALLLAAAPADVTLLRTSADVAALCRAIGDEDPLAGSSDARDRERAAAKRDAARTRRYEAVVPGALIVFAEHDPSSGSLAVYDGTDLPAAEGSANLYARRDRGLPVEVDARVAERIVAAGRAGTLTLTVTFELLDETPCIKNGTGRPRTVEMDPVTWSYRDGETVLARGVGRPVAEPVRGTPRVVVEAPLSGATAASAAVEARSSELRACYAKLLPRYPDLRGTLTFELGGPRPLIAIDSVANSALGTCTWRALAGLTFPEKALVPIRFALEPDGAAK